MLRGWASALILALGVACLAPSAVQAKGNDGKKKDAKASVKAKEKKEADRKVSSRKKSKKRETDILGFSLDRSFSLGKSTVSTKSLRFQGPSHSLKFHANRYFHELAIEHDKALWGGFLKDMIESHDNAVQSPSGWKYR